MKKGILTVVSGFSGAGKGTIIKELRKKYDYELSISATTRKPRKGDVDGVDYFFKTREEFEQMIEENKLIEWAEYVGNYYGTPKEYVEQQLKAGKAIQRSNWGNAKIQAVQLENGQYQIFASGDLTPEMLVLLSGDYDVKEEKETNDVKETEEAV